MTIHNKIEKSKYYIILYFYYLLCSWKLVPKQINSYGLLINIISIDYVDIDRYNNKIL